MIEHWIAKYFCGPGQHVYRSTGISMMPTAEAVQPGQRIGVSMEEILKCERCGKSGWERTVTCEICDWYPVNASPNRVLVLADGTRLSGVALCDACHVAAINGEAGLSVDWER